MPDASLAGRSILVVDDEEVFLRSLVEGIATELPGVNLYTASNGIEALKVLDKHLVDLLVTDVNMPQMDGLGLVAAMVGRGLRVPVIMVTAYGNREVEFEARRHGVLSVIDKPIDFSFLVEICRNTLLSLSHASLGGVTLAGLLQLLEMEQRSCTVRVFSNGQSGQIYVEGGQVVGSFHGGEVGMEAMRKILGWPTPAIELGPLRMSERSAPMPLQAVLLEVARREDELSHELDLVFEDEPPPETEPRQKVRGNARERERTIMANIEQAITTAMAIQGAIATALVDHESGMCLGSKANGFPIEIAAAGNTEVIRAKLRVMADLGLEGGISDILITLDTQYHLLVPLSQGSLFLYLAIDRKSGNLAMARHKLAAIEKNLVV